MRLLIKAFRSPRPRASPSLSAIVIKVDKLPLSHFSSHYIYPPSFLFPPTHTPSLSLSLLSPLQPHHPSLSSSSSLFIFSITLSTTLTMEVSTEKTKRLRDDSDLNSPVTKISRVDSDSDANSAESHLTRVNSGDECVNSVGYELVRLDSEDPALESPVASHIQNDLLNILDDTDNITTMQGLDSVIKSFEEEILASGPDVVVPDSLPDSGELQMDLGYLLEASDDELGLPPSVTPGEEAKPGSDELGRVGQEGVDMGELLGFENETANCDTVGVGSTEDNNDGSNVSFDELLNYAEPYDVLWRSESLEAM